MMSFQKFHFVTAATLLILVGTGSPAKAAITETPTTVSIVIDQAQEAHDIYFKLKFPEAMATDPNGKRAMMKRFRDSSGTVYFYCAQYSGPKFTCGAEIAKVSSSDHVAVEYTPSMIRATLTEPQTIQFLFEAIDVPMLQHAGYFMKYLNTEDLALSFSCLKGHLSSENDNCQLLIQN
ncbi:MAG: hypothetical protein JNJ49_07435 [Bdellovibrionaceae bacterium]|nr:hypothetical protein [Pseudobdellovibrionaceae bacterium]